MLLAAGLTPAWQQIAVLDRLRPGEVNRACEVHWCASGKVLNVGVALTQLGADARTLSLVGTGPAGEAAKREMIQLGVSMRWIDNAAPMRVCTSLLDRESGQTTEIVENSPAASREELTSFEAVFAEEAASTEFVILTGSLPTNTPCDFYSTLLKHARGQAILDIRGPELLAALTHRPFLVKPNREELSHTVNRPLPDDDSVWQAMTELRDWGIEWVVVTDGPRDVFVLHANNRWRLTPPKVEVTNPIGCGDCLTAGIAWGVQAEREPLEAIRLGIAAAAENATQLLPARLTLARVLKRSAEVVIA
jgi:tagatose 6-phosphate kinase